MYSTVEVPNSYSPGAITPRVAGPFVVSKAIDLTFPSKYSFVLNMVDWLKRLFSEHSLLFTDLKHVVDGVQVEGVKDGFNLVGVEKMHKVFLCVLFIQVFRFRRKVVLPSKPSDICSI